MVAGSLPEQTQRRRIEDAVSEWLGNVAIGGIPSLFHLLSNLLTDGASATPWLPDLVFWVIALSGTSGMQATFRMSKCRTKDAGRLPGALVMLSFVLVALSGWLYGLFVGHAANGSATPAAGALLFGSLISSAICDYVVAIRCET